MKKISKGLQKDFEKIRPLVIFNPKAETIDATEAAAAVEVGILDVGDAKERERSIGTPREKFQNRRAPLAW